MQSARPPHAWTLSPEDAGERLDKTVARLAGVSRQQAMAWIAAGYVRVDHRRPRKGDRATSGARVEVAEVPSDAPVPEPALALGVVHEDPWLLALDKPAGIDMHPLEPGETGTLAGAVVARYPDVAGASTEKRCPGLLHRLDRETSGVVLWARTPAAFDDVRRQFSERTVVKRYLALVEGAVDGEGVLEVPLAHDPKNKSRMKATPYPAEAEALGARPALTRWKAVAQGPDATLVEVEIPTGVMHQIRAHVAFAGHPVVGDTLYGAAPVEGLGRHLLHAASIEIAHPSGEGRARYDAPLPAAFRLALEARGIPTP